MAREHAPSTTIVGLPLVLIVFFVLLNLRYPSLGHDDRLFFPFLLEGRWYVAHQGLAPLRYAVHLCGGFPLYGNPNDLFYSLTQLLALVWSPWVAVQISAGVMLCAGYAGWTLVGRDVLMLPRQWRHLLGLVMTASGFYFSHIIVGHLNFLTLPLLGMLAWLVFDRRVDGGERFVLRTTAFALIAGVIVYGGGYYVMVYFSLLVGIAFPLYLCLAGSQVGELVRRTLPRLAVGAAGAMLVSASKVMAVASLLRSLHYSASMPHIDANQETLWYVVKALWAIPQSSNLFDGVPWSLHEKSHFISPVVAVGLLAGCWLLCHPQPQKRRPWKVMLVALHTLVVVLFFCQLIRGYGVIASLLFSLPVFSSFRVPTRFLCPLTIWLSILSIVFLRQSVGEFLPKWEPWIVRGAVLATIAGFAMAYLPTIGQFELYLDDRATTSQLLQSLRDGYDKPVDAVQDDGVSFDAATTLTCTYETVFIAAGDPQKRSLHLGPVTDVQNGAFNLANPSCYQYGKENDCHPGDPISVLDSGNFEAFRSGRPVTWKVSEAQHLADLATLFTLVFCLAALAGEAFTKRHRSASIHMIRSVIPGDIS